MLGIIRPSQLPAEIELERLRHAAEVQFVIDLCFPDSDKATRYFNLCAEHRTLLEVERLKSDTREAWRIRTKAESATCH